MSQSAQIRSSAFYAGYLPPSKGDGGQLAELRQCDVSNDRCQAKLAQTVPHITSRSSVLAFDRAHLDVVMRKLVPELQAFS